MEKLGMTFTRKSLYEMLQKMTLRQVAVEWHLDLRSLVDAVKVNDIPCIAIPYPWISQIRKEPVRSSVLEGDPAIEVYIPYSIDAFKHDVLLFTLCGTRDVLDQMIGISLDQLPLTERAVSALSARYVHTLLDVLSMSIDDLSAIKGLGWASVEHIVVTCLDYCRTHIC